jgi:hypothetical protein
MTESLPVVRKRGRPKKADIEAAKKPGNGKVGRPVGDNGRIQELKARLMATAGTKVIDKIIHIALNDEHPGQMAALKLCIDRQLPISLFEKDAKRGSNAITINITGVGNVESTESDTIEADDIDYEEQDT